MLAPEHAIFKRTQKFLTEFSFHLALTPCVRLPLASVLSCFSVLEIQFVIFFCVHLNMTRSEAFLLEIFYTFGVLILECAAADELP